MNLSTSSLKPTENKLSDDNMIPLINIIFLLLIFYMIAGHIQASQPQGLELPVNSNKDVTQQTSTTLHITVNNMLYINGKASSLEEFATVLSVDHEIKKNTINIQADRRLSAQQLDSLLAVLREHDVQNIELISQKIL
ncbi:MAG: ExbD/TolR family protein [Arenicella sp.]